MEKFSKEQARSNAEDATAAQDIMNRTAGLQTPRSRRSKRLKKVRFSDPGPRIGSVEGEYDDASASTGLTPAVSRTRLGSLHAMRNGVQKKRAPTPGRRRSAPTPRIGGTDLKYESAPESPARDSRNFQFLPFHDVLDTRTMRRIARSGFSEEMNKIEGKKREKQRIEKAKNEELNRLRDELEVLRGVKMEMEEEGDVAPNTPERTRELMMARQKVQELEGLLRQNKGQTSGFIDISHASPCPTTPRDEDMLSLAGDVTMDDTVAFSSSPAPSRINTLTPATSVASMQVDFESPQRGNIESAYEELELLRREKHGLFKEWRALVHPGSPCSATADVVEKDDTRPMSPPPGFIDQIICALRASSARELDAVTTIDNLYKELSSHGFEGSNAEEVLANIGARLRQARIDLERAVPGETTDSDLANWKEIIDALVGRIHFLVQDATTSRAELSNCITQEKVLRGQFNASLLRLEKTEKRNTILEQDADSMAEDMLHARMKMQALEKDIKSLETDKGRLSKAIENYRADLKILETLNMKLEDEALQYREESSNLREAKSGLESEVQEYQKRVEGMDQNLLGAQLKHDEIQTLLDQRNSFIESLEAKISRITADKEAAISDLEIKAARKSQLHETELGALNARLSSLATSLSEAKSEVETLRQDKGLVEAKLQAFLKLFSKETIKAAHERVNETANALVEWERGMAMFDEQGECQNGKDGCEDADAAKSLPNGGNGGFAAIGSEPITPACESRFRNVELERGKKRKRRHPDSGIAMIEEEEE